MSFYINIIESDFSGECLNGSIQEVLTPPPQGLLQLSQGPQLAQEASTAESDD